MLDRLQQAQVQGYGHIPLVQLLLALVAGLLVPPLSALAHEAGHALLARRHGLVGVSLPRWDRSRLAARNGFGLTRMISAREPRGWVRLHPAVEPRSAVAIVAAGPAAELSLAALIVAAAFASPGAVLRSALLFTALDCVCGAVCCLVRRDGGNGDSVVLRHWVAALRAPRPAADPDPHAATSFGPPG